MTPDQLAAIHKAAFTHERPWSVAEFETLLASPHVYLIANDQAFALGRVVMDEAELLTLATHPQNRRTGLARRCLAAFEERVKTKGAAQAFLEVAEDNLPAIALYRAFGYRITGQRPDYYTRDNDESVAALTMAKSLYPHP